MKIVFSIALLGLIVAVIFLSEAPLSGKVVMSGIFTLTGVLFWMVTKPWQSTRHPKNKQ